MGELSPKPPFSYGYTNLIYARSLKMLDSFTFEGEGFDDMSAPRSCETKGITHCPFTGEKIEAVEQKEFEPDFEKEFLEFYERNKEKEA